jgi:hypothetical protein
VGNPERIAAHPAVVSRDTYRKMTGQVEAMALYADQGIGQVSQVVLAAAVATELAVGADRQPRRGAAVQVPDSAMTQRSRGRWALAPPANALLVLQSVGLAKLGTSIPTAETLASRPNTDDPEVNQALLNEH